MQLATENHQEHIMQLAGEDASSRKRSESMDKLSASLDSAITLLNALNSAKGNSIPGYFYTTLRLRKESFPLTDSKYAESKASNDIGKITLLKHTLQSDTAALLGKAKEITECSKKTLCGEPLPSDPDACLQTLDEIRERKENLIEKLKKDLEDLKNTLADVKIMQEIKRSSSTLVEKDVGGKEGKKKRKFDEAK